MRRTTARDVLRSQLGFRPTRILSADDRLVMNEIDSRCAAIGLIRAFVALDAVLEKARACPARNVDRAAYWLRITRDEGLIESAELAALSRLWVQS